MVKLVPCVAGETPLLKVTVVGLTVKPVAAGDETVSLVVMVNIGLVLSGPAALAVKVAMVGGLSSAKPANGHEHSRQPLQTARSRSTHHR